MAQGGSWFLLGLIFKATEILGSCENGYIPENPGRPVQGRKNNNKEGRRKYPARRAHTRMTRTVPTPPCGSSSEVPETREDVMFKPRIAVKLLELCQ